ncbi:MAG: hypothetical protein IJS15_13815 [Victivallales bacterium]|nr:hypothetical protein [Victivallales bacterium]
MDDAIALKNGDALMLANMPSEVTAQVPKGGRLRFMLEETDCEWDADFNTGECDLTVEHRKGDSHTTGRAVVEVSSHVQTPVRVELECGGTVRRRVRLLVYTVGEQKAISPNYPRTPVFGMLMAACRKRGLVLTDWHIHIRGGMTPELAAMREEDCGIRSSAMENHGREWEIYDNRKLRLFSEKARAVTVNGHRLPTGIQVNDRDWFSQIDAETRACFDYILADTMIMGKLPSGRDNRLWLDQSIEDVPAWMNAYTEHTLRILGEPISILANPTYLPKEVAECYDELWTDERMKAVVCKAVEHGIALEIQAGSPFPRPKFLKLAKSMGAKFSFGTNNFDPTPKDLSRWLEVIEWLDLTPEDIWTAQRRTF